MQITLPRTCCSCAYLLGKKLEKSSTMMALGGNAARCRQAAYFCMSEDVVKYLSGHTPCSMCTAVRAGLALATSAALTVAARVSRQG